MARGRVVMGLFFFPRGGSAYVARYLGHAVADAGWDLSVVSGSLGDAGSTGNARTFFAGLDVHPLDFVVPAPPGRPDARSPISFEDREEGSDVALAALDPRLAEALAAAWEPSFTAARAGDAAVLHLHHLTPQHDTAARRCPQVPLLAHLHGTEIKFVEAVDALTEIAAAFGTTLAELADAGGPQLADGALDATQEELARATRWRRWRHGEHWAASLRTKARAADHVVVVSSRDQASTVARLGVEAERISVVPNGVDLELFRPRNLTAAERRARFRHWLVDDPRGWDETGTPGSVAYDEGDLDRLLGPDGDATVLIFVGRFTAAKRLPVLIRAFARARARFERTASVVVWGGSPGEWEGEHPVTVATGVGDDGVFFAGWRGHDDLPDALAACDALVMASVDDSYPQAPLEAMAVGLPVIATRSGGFPAMIDADGPRRNGWLVAPDDPEALAEALVDAVDHPDELARRGTNAVTHARAHFSWRGLVPRFEEAYAAATEHRARFGPSRVRGGMEHASGR